MNGKISRENGVQEGYDLPNGSPIKRVEYSRDNCQEVLTFCFQDGSQGKVSRAVSGSDLVISLLDPKNRPIPDTAEGPRLDYVITNHEKGDFNFQREMLNLIRTPQGRSLMGAYVGHLRHN
ncbi:MAG: hypothetical protein Q8Q31_05025 [Nanoarchaeota archaeon]|nr:hypothetical protein [Nanoarchaeota archaeon]